MTKLHRTILAAVLLIGLAGTSAGGELLSRPEIAGYPTPTAEYPEPRAGHFEYLDAAALAVALALASYLALVRRSRRGLFALSIASLAWFGFWRKGCVCSIGAIQNVTLTMFDPEYSISLTVLAFFTLPLVFTLFFGRTFCAAVCPLGAVQELVAVRPAKVAPWLEHALGILPFVYLGAAVLFAATGTAFVICEYDPFVGFFRLGGNANLIILGGCFLVVGLFVGRPYCRYLCPYGAVLGLLSKVSKWHVRIPPEECIQCRLCEDCCPYGAIREPTVPQSAAERARGRRRLALFLMLLPGLVVLGVWVGRGMAVPLSRLHPDVRLAEQIRLEQRMQEEVELLVRDENLAEDEAWEKVLGRHGQLECTTDAAEAFRNTGRPEMELYADAVALRAEFASAGRWLGGWVGLVIGVKLIQLSLRRRRVDYLPDPAGCLSCGRCFKYCPGERVRLGLIEEIPAASAG